MVPNKSPNPPTKRACHYKDTGVHNPGIQPNSGIIATIASAAQSSTMAIGACSPRASYCCISSQRYSCWYHVAIVPPAQTNRVATGKYKNQYARGFHQMWSNKNPGAVNAYTAKQITGGYSAVLMVYLGCYCAGKREVVLLRITGSRLLDTPSRARRGSLENFCCHHCSSRRWNLGQRLSRPTVEAIPASTNSANRRAGPASAEAEQDFFRFSLLVGWGACAPASCFSCLP